MGQGRGPAEESTNEQGAGVELLELGHASYRRLEKGGISGRR